FLKKYPEGAEVEQAKAKLATLSGFRVQLATAKNEKAAQAVHDKLNGKYPTLHDLEVVPVNSGKSFAVQSSPMSQPEADSACKDLKKAHQACEVVKNEAANKT